jgi:hypothetical protein
MAPYSVAGTNFAQPSADHWVGGNGILSNRRDLMNWPAWLPFSAVQDGLTNTIMIGEAIPRHGYRNAWGFFAGYDGDSSLASTAIPLNAKATCRDSGNWEADRVFCAPQHPDWWQATLGYASRHPAGGQFCLGDGSVRFLSETIDLNVYRSCGTASLGEAVSLP